MTHVWPCVLTGGSRLGDGTTYRGGLIVRPNSGAAAHDLCLVPLINPFAPGPVNWASMGPLKRTKGCLAEPSSDASLEVHDS